MTEPLVACIMLTRDRPAMARRAVEAFRAQTYPNKRLTIVNTGCFVETLERFDLNDGGIGHTHFPTGRLSALSIGELRNSANDAAIGGARAEVLVHWDDDDWSHPNRIAEQVALLQSSGAEVVGYNELLFWREGVIQTGLLPTGRLPATHEPAMRNFQGEAWLYSKQNNLPGALGTSLCYWRRTWERKPFPDLPKRPKGSGEDYEWLKGLNVVSVSALAPEGFQYLGRHPAAPT